MFGGKFWEGNYVLALSSLNKSPLNAASIPKFAELGLSGLGNSFKITQADSVATGTYAGSYSKNQTIPDPNCIKNGGVIDSGDHDSLMNNCKEYKSLYQKQLK